MEETSLKWDPDVDERLMLRLFLERLLWKRWWTLGFKFSGRFIDQLSNCWPFNGDLAHEFSATDWLQKSHTVSGLRSIGAGFSAREPLCRSLKFLKYFITLCNEIQLQPKLNTNFLLVINKNNISLYVLKKMIIWVSGSLCEPVRDSRLGLVAFLINCHAFFNKMSFINSRLGSRQGRVNVAPYLERLRNPR